jgi:hypothetical protein
MIHLFPQPQHGLAGYEKNLKTADAFLLFINPFLY